MQALRTKIFPRLIALAALVFLCPAAGAVTVVVCDPPGTGLCAGPPGNIVAVNAPVEENLIQTGDEEDLLSIPGFDVFEEGVFADFGNGADTVIITTNGSHNASRIGPGELLRNFERVRLFHNGGDSWTVGLEDRPLEWIDALPTGTDTLVLGGGDHDASEIGDNLKYRGFEYVSLSHGNNVWTVTGGDTGIDRIDALNGADTLALGNSVRNSAEIGAGGKYRNFERAVLSGEDDRWEFTDGDAALTGKMGIDALAGTDTVIFGDGGNHSAGYRNFERAELSDGENMWTATDTDDGFEYINALGGDDTVIFNAAGGGSARAVGAGGKYRNFESVSLEGGNDRWSITENDNGLTVNAGAGTDTLEAMLADAGSDGVFNAADLSFSDGDINTAKYQNFEQVAVGLTDGENSWTANAADTGKGWQWISGRDGFDTLILGERGSDAANIGAEKLYRNFERVLLSGGENVWTETDGDTDIERIDALGGTDTVIFGDGNHAMSRKYHNFEFANLSAADNIWTVSGADGGLVAVDALGGTDTIVLGDGGHNAADIGAGKKYRNFQIAELSGGRNFWTVTGGDAGLDRIDAAAGIDTIIFGDGGHSAEMAGAGGKYRNFEEAELSGGDNVWTVRAEDGNFSIINALGGTDTLALGAGAQNAADIGAGERYRNFERAALSAGNDIWTVTGGDAELAEIDALGGTDTLEDQLADTGGDGVFNAADSDFSSGDIGTGAYGNYSNFQQAAVGTGGGNDRWTADAADMSKGWQWINAREGTDIIIFGNGNHSAANVGAGEFYRNFEIAELSAGNNSWTAGAGDGGLEIIDALGGTDTVILGSGAENSANIGAERKYRNFEIAELSTVPDMWTVTEGDDALETVDALDGMDTVIFGGGHNDGAKYRNFEFANLSAGTDAWSVTAGDGQFQSINALGGTDTLEDQIADTGGDGVFNAMDSGFSASDIGTGAYANYAEFEQVAVGTGSGNDRWTVNRAADMDTVKGWRWINARGGVDTLAFGDGDHSAENVGAGGFYRSFERAELSDGENVWTVGTEDGGLETVDALGGTDTLAFGAGRHNGRGLGRYENFERATLSDGNDRWTAGAEDSALPLIDARGGDDTLAFGAGHHDGLGYANFERAVLSDENDAWSVTAEDEQFDRIDALGGTDTLEGMIADTGGGSAGGGSFNAADSGFSANSLRAGEYILKYRSFERAAIGLTGGADTWTANAADDTEKGWWWVNAREGKDTIVLGAGNHGAAAIGAGRFYRNFERAELSAGENVWFAGAGDFGLDEIDALGGTDTVIFGGGGHNGAAIGAGGRYRNFERAELSAGNNSWTVGAEENSSGLEWVDALGGTDTVIFGGGGHSAENVGENSFYRNFEIAELSAGNNSWTVGAGDAGFLTVDALGGIDTVIFGGGDHAMTAKYRSFERAELSDGENVWTVGAGDAGLFTVDALGGTDTVVFGGGDHSAADIGADKKYRSFERAELSAENNVWFAGAEDAGLAEIDALGGTDTLEGLLADTGGDGTFNAMDSDFSASDIGTGAYANYSGFEQAAVGTGGGNDRWTVNRAADMDTAKGWRWVSGRGGVDTLVFGSGDHSAADIGAGGFYRNFERAELSDGGNVWTVSRDEGGLFAVDGGGGTDTLAFGAGDHAGGSFARYENFELATLSSGNDRWAAGAGDAVLTSIDAMDGTDILSLGSGDHSAADIGDSRRYRNFENAELSEENNVWTVGAGDAGLFTVNALGGIDTVVFGSGSHSAADMGAGGKYRNFENVRLSGGSGDMWTVTAGDSEIENVDAMGGDGDTIVLGDGDHSSGEINIRSKYSGFERALLSDTANVWTVSETDEDLEYIDALGGADTLSFTGRRGSASQTGAAARYRGFENARLSDFDDSWGITAEDANFTDIDALGGIDYLEDQVADNGDGIFNASDSNFSASDLPNASRPGAYAKYRNFEFAAVGITDGDDLWTVNSAADTARGWAWINARGGYDTISLGDGNHDARNIGRFYRNFERAGLSTGQNTWTISEGDRELSEIDALGGFDTLEFGNGSHNGTGLERYRNFERARLSTEDDVWTVGAVNPDFDYIDALAGTDTLRFEALNPAGRVLGGNHSAADIGGLKRYRRFERVELGGGGDSWTVMTDGNGEIDAGIDFVDARGGADLLVVGNAVQNSANIGAGEKYRNFEAAALSAGNNSWTANAADDGGLFFIDALEGTDTLEFGGGNHSAINIGAERFYRNFERVELSAANNSWFVETGDAALAEIDALGGIDTLEDLLADEEMDGSFNAVDSDFSTAGLGTGTGAYGNYSNFEQAAVGTGSGNDIWTVNSAADTAKGWRWINARGGVDTLSFGDGGHSAINIGAERFYRNFERAALSDRDNRWEVAGGEDGLAEIDGRAGDDAIVFGDGAHGGNALGRYTNFERAELSGGENVWTVTGDEGNTVDIVDALGGVDAMLFDAGANTAVTVNGENVGNSALYRNFESLRKTGGGVLTVDRPLALESGGAVRIDEGTVSFNINLETAGGVETAANSGAIMADEIHISPNGAFAAGDFDVVRFSHIGGPGIALFDGVTVNAAEGTLIDNKLFTDIVARPDEGDILLALDSEEGAREEITDFLINSAGMNAAELNAAEKENLVNKNSREILVAAHRALRTAAVETGSDVADVVSRLDAGGIGGEAIDTLVPGDHAGVSYEIIDLQRVLFDSIEEKIVEAVRFMPWEERPGSGSYHAFASGFEKTSSGGLYKLGSRGYSAGIYRALFDSKAGLGISGAATFLETRDGRVSEKTNGFHGALYSRYETGGLSLRATLAAGTHDYNSERNLSAAFGGGSVTGETGITVYGGRVSAGFEVLRNLPVRIKPDLSFTVSRATADAYSENGGMNISIGESTMTSAEAGARINAAFNPLRAGLRTIVQPEIEAGVYYDFSAGDNDNVSAVIFGADSALLRPRVADDIRYFAGGKLVLSDNRKLAFKVGYRVDFWNGMRSYTGSGQFHLRF